MSDNGPDTASDTPFVPSDEEPVVREYDLRKTRLGKPIRFVDFDDEDSCPDNVDMISTTIKNPSKTSDPRSLETRKRSQAHRTLRKSMFTLQSASTNRIASEDEDIRLQEHTPVRVRLPSRTNPSDGARGLPRTNTPPRDSSTLEVARINIGMLGPSDARDMDSSIPDSLSDSSNAENMDSSIPHPVSVDEDTSMPNQSSDEASIHLPNLQQTLEMIGAWNITQALGVFHQQHTDGAISGRKKATKKRLKAMTKNLEDAIEKLEITSRDMEITTTSQQATTKDLKNTIKAQSDEIDGLNMKIRRLEEANKYLHTMLSLVRSRRIVESISTLARIEALEARPCSHQPALNPPPLRIDTNVQDAPVLQPQDFFHIDTDVQNAPVLQPRGLFPIDIDVQYAPVLQPQNFFPINTQEAQLMPSPTKKPKSIPSPAKSRRPSIFSQKSRYLPPPKPKRRASAQTSPLRESSRSDMGRTPASPDRRRSVTSGSGTGNASISPILPQKRKKRASDTRARDSRLEDEEIYELRSREISLDEELFGPGA